MGDSQSSIYKLSEDSEANSPDSEADKYHCFKTWKLTLVAYQTLLCVELSMMIFYFISLLVNEHAEDMLIGKDIDAFFFQDHFLPLLFLILDYPFNSYTFFGRHYILMLWMIGIFAVYEMMYPLL